MTPRTARVLSAVLAALAAPAIAQEATPVPEPAWQVHGFVSQGFALSDGNNALGSSTDGSAEFYELGVNGSVDLGHGWLASGQALVRRAGELDDGDLRLDYGLVDWQAVADPDWQAGVRAGRVKNPFGLFNDTRDVIFTRPGILLPQSVYFDALGVRDFLFSADGGQVYGGWSRDDDYLSLIVSRAADYEPDADQRRAFGGSQGEVRVEDFTVARLLQEWDSGQFRLGLTWTAADFSFRPDAAQPGAGNFMFDLYVLSARYNAEHWSLTGEYLLTLGRGRATIPGYPPRFESASDGAYLQLDWHPEGSWSVMGRIDASYNDRNDRDGRSAERRTGQDRHAQFTLDAVMGAAWRPDPQWGLWAEYHRMHGSSTVSALENPGAAPDPHWGLLLLMGGYRF